MINRDYLSREDKRNWEDTREVSILASLIAGACVGAVAIVIAISIVGWIYG